MVGQYALELAGLMAVFSFAIVSPGADTAMVMRQTLFHGRRAGVFAACGVGASLLFHMGYTILGLGLVVANSLLLFSILKWAGAAYLIYMGVQALRSPVVVLPDHAGAQGHEMSAVKSFGLGFLTNALNPKAILFFLSLFSTLVSPITPSVVKFGYGMVMASCLTAWFCAVACFMTVPRIRAGFQRAGAWISRATGLVFIALGLKLALARAE